MPDKPRTDNGDGKPQEHPAPTSLSVRDAQPEPQTEAPKEQPAPRPVRIPLTVRVRTALGRHWDKTGLSEFKAAEHWTLAVAVIGLFVATITLRVFKQQLGEMKTQTDTLIQQTETENAGASHRAVETDRQLRVLQKQADAADKTAAATAESVEQLRLAQRAWVGATTTSASPLAADQVCVARTVYKNVGKTPALHVTSITRVDFVKGAVRNFPRPSFAYKAKEFVDVGSLMPDEATFSDFLIKFEQKDIDSVERTARTYVHGCIEYDDTFSVHHWKNFCAFLLPTGAWSVCRFHNEIDETGSRQRQCKKAN